MRAREFKTSDIPHIAQMFTEELGYEMSPRYLERRIQQMQIEGGYQIFVMADKNDVAGFIGVHTSLAFEYEGKVMRIIGLATKKEYQGKGIGRRLLKKAEKYATENGVAIIAVNSGLSRESAHIFYQKRGYTKKGFSFAKKL